MGFDLLIKHEEDISHIVGGKKNLLLLLNRAAVAVEDHCETSEGRARLPGCSKTSGHFHVYREKEREGRALPTNLRAFWKTSASSHWSPRERTLSLAAELNLPSQIYLFQLPESLS